MTMALIFIILIFPSSWVHEKERQDIIVSGWKRDNYRKPVFFNITCFIIPFKLSAWKKKKKKKENKIVYVWGGWSQREKH